MEASSIPAKFPTPWAVNAGPTFINPVPAASQISINPGFASLNDGFVPLNATPVAVGGIPPRIQDWNGILKESTSWDQWFQMGGPITYDATFQGQIGGYPNGAVIQSAAFPGVFWLSTVDNNTTDPDTGGAGWVSLPIHGRQSLTAASGSFTVPNGVTSLKVRLWGDGGGSGGTGGAPPSGSEPGSGGGYINDLIAVTPGQEIDYTIGQGGAAGVGGASPTAGGNGTGSTFGPLSAGGGLGGNSGFGGIATAVQAGGTTSGGSSNALRVNGGTGNGAFSVGATNVVVGQGGGAFGIPPAHAGVEGVSAAGIPGTFPGGGASGSCNTANGAAGAAGQCIVEW
jgi:hypothetical protein